MSRASPFAIQFPASWMLEIERARDSRQLIFALWRCIHRTRATFFRRESILVNFGERVINTSNVTIVIAKISASYRDSLADTKLRKFYVPFKLSIGGEEVEIRSRHQTPLFFVITFIKR